MPIREAVRHSDMRSKAAVELAVAIVSFLVEKEIRIVLGIACRVQRTAAYSVHPVDQGAPGGRTLESELGAKPGNLAAVRGVVNGIPDVPLVVGAVVGIVGMEEFVLCTW